MYREKRSNSGFTVFGALVVLVGLMTVVAIVIIATARFENGTALPPQEQARVDSVERVLSVQEQELDRLGSLESGDMVEMNDGVVYLVRLHAMDGKLWVLSRSQKAVVSAVYEPHNLLGRVSRIVRTDDASWGKMLQEFWRQ